MPKIDVSKVPEKGGTGYPAHLQELVAGRFRKRLGDAGGIIWKMSLSTFCRARQH
jgi:uncharacterized cupin superfamily protein